MGAGQTQAQALAPTPSPTPSPPARSSSKRALVLTDTQSIALPEVAGYGGTIALFEPTPAPATTGALSSPAPTPSPSPSPAPTGPALDITLAVAPAGAPRNGSLLPILRVTLRADHVLSLPGLAAFTFKLPAHEVSGEREFSAKFFEIKKARKRSETNAAGIFNAKARFVTFKSGGKLELNKGKSYAVVLYGSPLATPLPATSPIPVTSPLAAPAPASPLPPTPAASRS